MIICSQSNKVIKYLSINMFANLIQKYIKYAIRTYIDLNTPIQFLTRNMI